MTKLSSFAVALAVAAIVSVEAFTSPSLQKMTAFSREVRLFEDKKDAAANTEAVFMPPSDDDVDEDMMFEKAEALGRGSSKVCLLEGGGWGWALFIELKYIYYSLYKLGYWVYLFINFVTKTFAHVSFIPSHRQNAESARVDLIPVR
jgi:hypothetical protein